jgi:predicted nucleic acid-binding protein
LSYLVDANVLSEPTRPSPNEGVIAWLQRHEAELNVDPIIVGELQFGILLLPQGRRRVALERWFDAGVRRLRCVDWDASTGLRWARLLADLRIDGHAVPIKDSLIAATALTHGFTIVTRNVRDFEPTGVEVLDPFAT